MRLHEMKFKILKNEEAENFVEGFLEEYWDFDLDPNAKKAFKFTQTHLCQKYKLAPHKLHSLAAEIGKLEVFQTLLCGKCEGFTYFGNRHDFSLRPPINIPDTKGFCEACFRQEKVDEVERLLNSIEYKFDNNFTINIEPKLSNLSYLDKIVLYHIINAPDLNTKQLHGFHLNYFLKTELTGLRFIFEKLIKHRFIVHNENIYDNLDEASKIYSIFRSYDEYFSEEYLINVKNKLNSLGVGEQSFIAVPSSFSGYYEFSNYLLEEISQSTINFKDVKEIKRYIEGKRYSDLVKILSDFCEELGINPEIKIKDATLILIGENFNLKNAVNIFEWKSTDVKAMKFDEFKYGKKGYSGFNKYLASIRKYVDYLLANPDSIRYEKNVLDIYEESKIERFIFFDILKINQRWEGLTTKEITQLWLDKVEVVG